MQVSSVALLSLRGLPRRMASNFSFDPLQKTSSELREVKKPRVFDFNKWETIFTVGSSVLLLLMTCIAHCCIDQSYPFIRAGSTSGTLHCKWLTLVGSTAGSLSKTLPRSPLRYVRVYLCMCVLVTGRSYLTESVYKCHACMVLKLTINFGPQIN